MFGIGTAPEGSTLEYTDRYDQADRGDLRADPGGRRAYYVIAGFPTVVDGNALLRLKPWERARPQAAGDRRRAAAEVRRSPACIAFPINPPSLGQRSARRRSQFVIRCRRRLRGAAARSSTACSSEVAQESRHAEPRQPTCGSTSRELRVERQPRQGRRTSASRSTPSAARSRRCSAGGR